MLILCRWYSRLIFSLNQQSSPWLIDVTLLLSLPQYPALSGCKTGHLLQVWASWRTNPTRFKTSPSLLLRTWSNCLWWFFSFSLLRVFIMPVSHLKILIVSGSIKMYAILVYVTNPLSHIFILFVIIVNTPRQKVPVMWRHCWVYRVIGYPSVCV